MSQPDYTFDDSSNNKPSSGKRSLFSFFHPDVREIFLKPNDRYRFLPAFSPSKVPSDTTYATSVGPYRAGQPDKGHLPLTNWFKVFPGHKCIGRDMSNIVSPRYLQDLATSNRQVAEFLLKNPLNGVDPIDTLRRAVKECKSKEELDRKTGSGDETKSVYPWPKDQYAYNVGRLHAAKLMIDPKDVGVTLLAPMAHTEAIVRVLNIFLAQQGVALNAIDPFAAKYALGDITHPKTGLVAVHRKIAASGNNSVRFSGPVFTDEEQMPTDTVALEVGNDILVKRLQLGSSSTIKIPTSQSIVDYYMAGMMPDVDMDFARKVFEGKGWNCGARPVNIPAQVSSTADPVDEGFNPEEATGTLPSAQVTKALAPSQAFWVCVDGVVLASTAGKADVIALLDEGKDVLLCPEGKKEWEQPSKFGISATPKVAAPPPPPPAKAAPPPPPSKPTPPPAPAKSAPPPVVKPAPQPQAAIPSPAATKPVTPVAPVGIPDDWEYYSICANMRTNLTEDEIQEMYRLYTGQIAAADSNGTMSESDSSRLSELFDKASV